MARCYPPRASVVLYGIVLMSWLGFCWIFWAEPRYRYVPEVTFCVLTALAVHAAIMTVAQRRPPEAASA